jgi:hypothetical protein
LQLNGGGGGGVGFAARTADVSPANTSIRATHKILVLFMSMILLWLSNAREPAEHTTIPVRRAS